MRLGRLRAGELLVAGGLVALLVTLFLDWFHLEVRRFCDAGQRPLGDEACDALTSGNGFSILGDPVEAGWVVLGHPWLELLGLFAVGLALVLVLALAAAPGHSTFGAMVSLTFTLALGVLVLVLTLIRLFPARPDATLPSFADSPPARIGVELAAGAWVGLGAIVVAIAGLYLAIRDDRPRSADSRFDPPPPRPVPPPRPPAPDGAVEDGPPAG